jgi:hypothetical protein
MRMRMTAKLVRVSMFVRGINGMHMIMAMLSLVHHARLERFVRAATAADGEC